MSSIPNLLTSREGRALVLRTGRAEVAYAKERPRSGVSVHETYVSEERSPDGCAGDARIARLVLA
jgi:hypothetical protein